MTRDDVNRILRQMEQCRELQGGAESDAERRRFGREYRQMWKAIKPYVEKTLPYTEAPAPAVTS